MAGAGRWRPAGCGVRQEPGPRGGEEAQAGKGLREGQPALSFQSPRAGPATRDFYCCDFCVTHGKDCLYQQTYLQRLTHTSGVGTRPSDRLSLTPYPPSKTFEEFFALYTLFLSWHLNFLAQFKIMPYLGMVVHTYNLNSRILSSRPARDTQ
jgi:hypothetical protein